MKNIFKTFLIISILIFIILILKNNLLSGQFIISRLRNAEDLNFIIVFIAGMVDGINPCALSMLLFFITFSVANDSKNTNILLLGFMFALGTFISYFLAGVGILKVIYLGKYITNFHIIIYFFTSIIAFLLAYMNLKDAISAGKHDIGNIKLQLPKKNKIFIHNIIKKFTNYKFKYLVSLILGFIVTLSELLCTGQVYLATMVTIHNLDVNIRTAYLLIFNLGFIFPIIIISFVIHKGKEVMDMTDILFNKLLIIKYITAAIMFIFGVISIVNLISVL